MLSYSSEKSRYVHVYILSRYMVNSNTDSNKEKTHKLTWNVQNN